MSIVDIKPSELPIDLRVKVESVMKRERLAWRDTLLFLARKVVSPSRERRFRAPRRTSFCPEGDTTSRGGSAATSDAVAYELIPGERPLDAMMANPAMKSAPVYRTPKAVLRVARGKVGRAERGHQD